MNHLVIIVRDQHVAFTTTEGRNGSHPLEDYHNPEATIDYLVSVIPHDTSEVLDDRTIRLDPPPCMSTIAAECFLTAVIITAITYFIIKHL